MGEGRNKKAKTRLRPLSHPCKWLYELGMNVFHVDMTGKEWSIVVVAVVVVVVIVGYRRLEYKGKRRVAKEEHSFLFYYFFEPGVPHCWGKHVQIAGEKFFSLGVKSGE
jgi:hypothetical protein